MFWQWFQLGMMMVLCLTTLWDVRLLMLGCWRTSHCKQGWRLTLGSYSFLGSTLRFLNFNWHSWHGLLMVVLSRLHLLQSLVSRSTQHPIHNVMDWSTSSQLQLHDFSNMYESSQWYEFKQPPFNTSSLRRQSVHSCLLWTAYIFALRYFYLSSVTCASTAFDALLAWATHTFWRSAIAYSALWAHLPAEGHTFTRAALMEHCSTSQRSQVLALHLSNGSGSLLIALQCWFSICAFTRAPRILSSVSIHVFRWFSLRWPPRNHQAADWELPSPTSNLQGQPWDECMSLLSAVRQRSLKTAYFPESRSFEPIFPDPLLTHHSEEKAQKWRFFRAQNRALKPPKRDQNYQHTSVKCTLQRPPHALSDSILRPSQTLCSMHT